MDDKQTKLEVGAGLQEGRINQEFKEFLEKWSLPVLAVVAVVVGIYSGSKMYASWRAEQRDQAFVTLEEVRGEIGSDGLREGSPDSLLALADELEGRGAVSLIARLDAADIYLGAVRRGIAPGTNLSSFSNDAFVEGELADSMLDMADEQYRRVADRTRRSQPRAALYIRAMFGSASVALSREDGDEARRLLTEVADRAEELGYDAHAQAARERIEQVDQWIIPIALISQRDLDPYLNNPFATRLDDETVELRPIPFDEVPPQLFNPDIFPEGFGQPKEPAEGEDPPPQGEDESAPAPAEDAPDSEPDEPSDAAETPTDPN